MKDLFEIEKAVTRHLNRQRERVAANPGMDERILSDVIAAHEAVLAKASSVKATHWRHVVTKGIAVKCAAAAMLVAAVVVGLRLTGKSADPIATAFADALRPLVETRSATFAATVSSGGSTVMYKGYYLAPQHMRLEGSNGETVVSDTGAGAIMVLMPGLKEAKIVRWKVASPAPGGFDLANIIATLKKRVDEASEGRAGAAVSLGREEIDGVAAVGYRTSGGDLDITVWADEATHMPVRAELTLHAPIEEAFVLSDIKVNVPVGAGDAPIFAINAPQGYTVTDVSAEAVQPPLAVSGVVKDAETGEPVAGATVSDEGYGPKPYKSCVADAQGKYQYRTWSEEHHVVATAPDYRPQRQLLVTTPMQKEGTATLDFALERESTAR